jgi:L-lactate dehydrogenase (cytochrome)
VGIISSRWHDRSLDLRPASVSDYRAAARARLPRQLFDYIDGGAYEEVTMAANRADLASIELRQRVLRDVASIDRSTTVLGIPLAMPVILAPVGLAGMFARRAEVQAARAAERHGVAFCESTVSICPLEEVAGATAQPPWFQLYVMRDRSFAEGLMDRAQQVGSPVLVLTVDLSVVGERYRDSRNAMVGPASPTAKAVQALDIATHPRWVLDVGIGGKPLVFGNLTEAVPGARNPREFKEYVDSQFDASVTWDDLAWVRSHWPGRLVLKGILDPEDARRAIDEGVDGIVVSNHGGRQLDSTPSTASALGAIAEAVNHRIAVLADGGVRSGLDVVKMVALGADACLIGRPWAFAVAAAGEAGVSHALEVIEHEMDVAMALTGVTSIDEIDRSILVDRSPSLHTR